MGRMDLSERSRRATAFPGSIAALPVVASVLALFGVIELGGKAGSPPLSPILQRDLSEKTGQAA